MPGVSEGQDKGHETRKEHLLSSASLPPPAPPVSSSTCRGKGRETPCEGNGKCKDASRPQFRSALQSIIRSTRENLQAPRE